MQVPKTYWSDRCAQDDESFKVVFEFLVAGRYSALLDPLQQPLKRIATEVHPWTMVEARRELRLPQRLDE
jgi:hypothetical protein